MVNLLLTIEASIARWALAEVSTLRVVCTTPPVKAGTICTGIGTQLAVVTIKTRWAGTLVAIVVVLK